MRSNEEIVQILLEEKDKQGLSLSELARRVDMAKSALSRYFNLTRQFPLNRADDFARVLHITPEYLLGLGDENQKKSSVKQQLNEVFDELKEKRQLKVVDYAKSELKEQKASDSKVKEIADYIVSKSYDFYDDAVSAGTGQFISDSQKEQVTLPVDYEADFVVPVYGTSMEPEYHDGDYIFVKLSVDLSDGDIGVFEYYGDTYVKQLVIEDDHAFLHSLNKKYKDMLVDADSDFRIIGKVVGRFA